MEDKKMNEHIEFTGPDNRDAETATTTAYTQSQLSRRIARKYDKHVLPLVWVLFILSYLDRSNIGNAKTAGAQDDLGLSSSQWAWILLSFYITYTCLEWMVLFWKLLPAHAYVAFITFGWGVTALCTGLVHSFGGFIACRVILAVFEAGFGAGVPYYLSLAYKRRELGFRLSILLGSSPIANCVAGAMAYGIVQIRSPLESWRLIFFIEGAPTLVMVPFVWFYLMDTPSTAKFLSAEEKAFAKERMETRDNTSKQKLNLKQSLAGLSDYKNWCHALLHFSCNYSLAALSNFLPTIVHSMGYNSINAQGLTAPPYLGAFITSILAAWASDRYGQRGWIMSLSAGFGTVGYALLATQTGTGLRYLGIWLGCIGVFPALAINMTWMLNNNAGETKRGIGMSMLAIIGQCSSFVASTVFPSSDGPFFVKGTAIGCGLTGLMVPAAIILRSLYAAENRKKDREYGPAKTDGMPLDVTEDGDLHRDFRLLT